MKNPSTQTRLFHPVLSTIAVIGLSAGVQATAPEKTCNALASAYAEGMPVAEEAAPISVTEKAQKLSADFRNATRMAEQSFVCFDNAWTAASTDAEKEAINAGRSRAFAVYGAARAQFEMSLEAISNELLTGVAPAAGPGSRGGNTAWDNSALDGMEVLFDSYMLVERAHELTRRFAGKQSKAQ